jgi:predicted membrane channel-forming protein YqfA (hemolysin III family)
MQIHPVIKVLFGFFLVILGCTTLFAFVRMFQAPPVSGKILIPGVLFGGVYFVGKVAFGYEARRVEKDLRALFEGEVGG